MTQARRRVPAGRRATGGTYLAAFGLTTPAQEVSVTLDDGTRRVLHVSSQTNDKETDKGHYATVDDKRDIFLLTADMLKRVEVSLPELEKR